MTVAELTGRELEIATAKALGWTAHAGWWGGARREGWAVNDPTFPPKLRWHCYTTEQEAWQSTTPRYLTDPVAFASVLAALDADQVRTNILFTPHLGEAIASIIDTWNEVWDRGKTREEAMLKVFVKWKQAIP